jgi:CPA2 family monovalent cation:H+ antiporter-2
MAVKSLVVYGLCRIAGSSHRDALSQGFLLSQGGEFGFVLFTAAAASGVFDAATTSLLIAIVTVTMALTPFVCMLPPYLVRNEEPEELAEDFEGAGGAEVFMIGFSRFGQIAAQVLLAGGRSVTVIDQSADRIRQASRFGFRIYFGDGTRKDVLDAAGIAKARIIAICTNKREITDQIVAIVQSEYPEARIYARSYDRVHTLALRQAGVEYEIRETIESALAFGRHTLEGLGMAEPDALAIADDIRTRDEARLQLQAVDGIAAGRELMLSRPMQPEPLVRPRKDAAE